MAAADSIVSPTAARALELLATSSGAPSGAGPDPHADRDVSVNQTFSRQFFEALERDTADGTGAEAAAPAAGWNREPGLQGLATRRLILAPGARGIRRSDGAIRDAQIWQSSGMIGQL